MSKEEQKEAMKEAMAEWLDDKFALFGKWTAGGLLAAAFFGLVYLGLTGQGWKK